MTFEERHPGLKDSKPKIDFQGTLQNYQLIHYYSEKDVDATQIDKEVLLKVLEKFDDEFFDYEGISSGVVEYVKKELGL